MKKTTVLITIDTEFSTHKDDLGIFGQVNGQRYGLPKIAELLDKYNLKATFFVDVYTNKKEYLDEFKKICLDLKEKGHDLQLHTHPDGMFDPERGGMKDYSLSEQIEILKKGKEIFQDWFQDVPIAHRAGDWGANGDTLKALKENDIPVDSSFFFGWPNCRLNETLHSHNKPVESKGVLQLPASVFHCVGLGMFKPYRLLSTDGNPYSETMDVLKHLQNDNVDIVNTVYHSFSFIKWNKDRTEYSVDNNRIEKFERFLKTLSASNEFEVKTVSEVYDLYREDKNQILNSPESLPKTGVQASLLRLCDRLRK